MVAQTGVKAAESAQNVVTGIIRFSYANVWEPKLTPSNKLKYSACLLLNKKDVKEKARWDSFVERAILDGIKKGKFTVNQRPILKTPIRDGDAEIKTGQKKPGQGYEGHWFVNCNSDQPPDVTKPQGGSAVPILDQNEFYSGVKGRAIVSFYPYNEGGSRGIAVGLNGCYKTGEGDRLDGRVNVASVFDAFAEDDGDLDEVVAPPIPGAKPVPESESDDEF